jgi:hypothetical protein
MGTRTHRPRSSTRCFVGAGATRDLVLLSLSRRGLSAFESRVQFRLARAIGTRRGVAWYAREEVQVWVVWCDKAWCGVVWSALGCQQRCFDCIHATRYQ